MIRGLILDLDGTVYRGNEEVPGAGAFLRRMKAQGVRLLFVTNRANRPVSAVCAHLQSYNIPCEPADVLTTAQAAAEYVGQRRTYLIGESGIYEEFARQNIPLDAKHPECVVVSLDGEFDYTKLRKAANFIRGGAEFIISNPDAWLKMDTGIFPGTGSLAAAIATGSGKKPIVIGKPERRLFDQAVRMMGLRREELLAIGDNLETDVLAALRAEIRAALILTGVSTRADLARSEVHPTCVAEDYAELEALIAAENAGGPPIAAPPRLPAHHADSQRWINELGLTPHPEGGHFRETYRAAESLPKAALPARYDGPRAISTSILYLLADGEFSAFHRLRSDEVWYMHAGQGLRIHVIAPDGVLLEASLGNIPGTLPQIVIPAGHWFAAEPHPHGYALIGCTVAPGFDPADFELASQDALTKQFPAHAALIGRLTRT